MVLFDEVDLLKNNFALARKTKLDKKRKGRINIIRQCNYRCS